MTLKELSQLYYLKQEIETDQRRLNRLKEERDEEEDRLLKIYASIDGLASPNFDGMPHSTDVGSKLENTVLRITETEERLKGKRAAILQLETIISQRQTLCLMERARMEAYIAAIPDSMTRQIFTARFMDGLSWEAVADAVQGNTVDSVKKTCYRYIRMQNE